MVGSISNIGHNTYTPVKSKSTDNTDSEIKSLQSQIDEIRKQISEMQSGKSGVGGDIQQQIKPLQEQIEQIEAQIQQLQLSKTTDKTDDNNINNNANNNKKLDDDKENNNENALLLYGNVYNEIRKTNSMAKHSKAEAAVNRSDAEFDERLGNYTGAAKKRKLAAQNEARANVIAGKASKLEKQVVDSTDKVNTDQNKVIKAENTYRANDIAKDKNEDDLDKGQSVDIYA